MGVKQGDCLSPTLFAIFINDLASEVKNSGVGLDLNIDNNDGNIEITFLNILLYADDIVLFAENELDLQFLLNIVETWCEKWRLEVNLTKTNILHIRVKRKLQSRYMFLFNKRPVPYCTFYKYLGCTINEYLDYSFTAEVQSDSAGRALSSIITKMIKIRAFHSQYIVFFIKHVFAVLVSMPVKCLGLSNMTPHLKSILEQLEHFLGCLKMLLHLVW